MRLQCPIPIEKYPQITMAHGGGGRLMNHLIAEMLFSAFKNPILDQNHDAAVFPVDAPRLAMSTDSYTITPLFFPGGDIGSLAVHGTVNDLAMAGAKPMYLSLGLIIEEGFAMNDLWRIVLSIKEAANQAGVSIITGDTKVVEKGKADGIYINTAGVGAIYHALKIEPRSVRPKDAILINGDLGRHGMAIMAERENMQFESTIQSDSTYLNHIVEALLAEKIDIHVMRDLTRGGLASALNEICEVGKVTMRIDENKIPVYNEVRGACEILGFDPLYVANEGKMVVIVRPDHAEKALAIMRRFPAGQDSVLIGYVDTPQFAPVLVKSALGAERVLDMLSGEQLPRIC